MNIAITTREGPRKALSDNEHIALLEFARGNGRSWKAHLRHAWETGNYRNFDAQALQSLRNRCGPTWLHDLKLNTTTGEYW